MGPVIFKCGEYGCAGGPSWRGREGCLMGDSDVIKRVHLKNEVEYWRGGYKKCIEDRRHMAASCCLWMASINQVADSIFDELAKKDG